MNRLAVCPRHNKPLNTKGNCNACKQLAWHRQNPDDRAAKTRYRRGIKRKALDAYGGACTCCGETAFEFLTIDHINGRSDQDDVTGDKLYRYVRDHGYPPDYRVLCMNCNSACGFYGYCPHERERLQSTA